MDWIGLVWIEEKKEILLEKKLLLLLCIRAPNCYDLQNIEREHFNICHLEMRMTFCYRQTIHSIYLYMRMYCMYVCLYVY